MVSLSALFLKFSARARQKRAKLFHKYFILSVSTRILDLGCGDGSNMVALLQGSPVLASNVYAADINVSSAVQRFGYHSVNIPEEGALPFADKFFDIVFCSSVIEHVTVKKEDVYKINSGSEFAALASARQQAFATEIERVGKRYFVQTPYKWFAVESHTWLPFVGWLPRELLIPLLSLTNSVWIKKTAPDWHLLTGADMKRMFPNARIVYENFLGFKKSVMAIKTL